MFLFDNMLSSLKVLFSYLNFKTGEFGGEGNIIFSRNFLGE